VFDRPFYLLLNVAVGGNLGGEVEEETVFPQAMVVDYVRVFEPDRARPA
jgi:beta-glucanase (GH16 family)